MSLYSVFVCDTPLQLVSCLNALAQMRCSNFDIVCAGDLIKEPCKRLEELPFFHEHVTYATSKDVNVVPNKVKFKICEASVTNVLAFYPTPITLSILDVDKDTTLLYLLDDGVFSYLPLYTEPFLKVGQFIAGLTVYAPELITYNPSCDVLRFQPLADGCTCLDWLRAAYDKPERPTYSDEWLWVDCNFKHSHHVECVVNHFRRECEQQGGTFVRRLHPKLDPTLYKSDGVHLEVSNGVPLEVEFLLGRPLPKRFGTLSSSSAIYYALMCNRDVVTTDFYIDCIVGHLSELVEPWFNVGSLQVVTKFIRSYCDRYPNALNYHTSIS